MSELGLLHLRHGENPRRWRRAGFVVLMAWLPLVLLSALEDQLRGGERFSALLSHLAVHTRFLLGAPLLVLAEVRCVHGFDHIARHFERAGLVSSESLPAYRAALTSSYRLSRSRIAWVGLWLLGLCGALCFWFFVPLAEFPAWHLDQEGTRWRLSWAGYWHVLIGLPLIVALLCGWLWTLCLWTRFLARMGRLPLRLVPTHPDRTGGLRFVAYSFKSLWMFGLAIGTLAAGALGGRVAWGAADPLAHYLHPLGAALALVALLTAAPLLGLSPPLAQAMRRGLFDYGALAGQLGTTFERKWVEGENAPANPLTALDFSAMNGANRIVDAGYQLRLFPMHLPSFVTLLLATAFPFLPMALLGLPLRLIVGALKRVLF